MAVSLAAIVLAAYGIRNQTDGKIPVLFFADSTGVGGSVFIDGRYLGKMHGLRFANGDVSHEWRVLRGRRSAQLVTKKGDTLRTEFEAEESGVATFKGNP